MMRFWFAAILFLQSQMPVQQIQPGAITGRLLSAKGTPEAGVRIAAVPATEAEKNTGAAALLGISLTDQDGRYRLENIPPGRYYIFAGLIDLPSYYPNAKTLDRATAVEVDSGVTLSGIDFSMARPTSMTVAGRVAVPATMKVGDGWTITLTPQTRGVFGSSLQASVARDGSFEFSRVAPGDYRLASSLRGSMPINLKIDADLLDVIMPLVDCDAGVAVSGRLVGASQSPTQSISLTGSRVGCTAVTRPSADGSFTFTNVPGGTYQLQLSPTPLGWSSIPLTVANVDLENVQVPLPALIAVKGRVDVEGGALLPRPSRGGLVFVQAAQRTGGVIVTSPIQDDGTFELSLPKGLYRISLNGIPGGYYLKSMMAGALDLSMAYFDIRDLPPENIELTVGVVKRRESPGVRVTGRVTFPPTGALPRSEGVLLVSASGGRNPVILESSLAPDGSFEFTGVSPGTYSIETFPDNPTALYGIVVEKTDVSGIEFALPVLVKVNGGIEWADAEGAAAPAVRPNLSVQFTRKEGTRVLAWGALAQSDAFHFYLPEGDYRFSVSDIPGSFDLTSVTSGDANVLEDGIRIRSDSDPPKLRVKLRGK
jgi:hypothetical protein